MTFKINLYWLYCDISEKELKWFQDVPSQKSFSIRAWIISEIAHGQMWPSVMPTASGRFRVLESTISRMLTLFKYKDIIDAFTTSYCYHSNYKMSERELWKAQCKNKQHFPHLAENMTNELHDLQDLYKPPSSTIVVFELLEFWYFWKFHMMQNGIIKVISKKDWLMMGDIHLKKKFHVSILPKG